jgi:acyl-CoA thioesterase I
MRAWFPWLGPIFAALVLIATPGFASPERTVVFFGDSLTAGYGLDDPSTEAFPALIQRKIDAAGLHWRVVNAGLSGDTSADGLHRVDWILRQPVNVFVLELGGNDGLRGLPPEATRANLQSIIERVRAKQPAARILLVGILAPPNMGPDFTRAFAAIFPELAGKNKLPLVPFLLAGVAGQPALNQADGIHPNATGDKIVADTVWSALRPLL